MRTLFVRGFLVLSVLVLTSPLATSAQTVARSLDKWLECRHVLLQTEPDGVPSSSRLRRTCSAEWTRSKVDVRSSIMPASPTKGCRTTLMGRFRSGRR